MENWLWRLSTISTYRIAKFISQATEEIYCFYIALKDRQLTDRKMSKLITKEFGVKQQACAHGWSRITTLIALNAVLSPSNKYPRILVLASVGIRDNYVRFGDLVAFDITYGLLQMWLMTTGDSEWECSLSQIPTSGCCCWNRDYGWLNSTSNVHGICLFHPAPRIAAKLHYHRWPEHNCTCY